MGMFTIILLALIGILILWAIGAYNKLISLRNQVKNAWSQIDVQLQRRYDLIPNLVETAKGYMNFEKGTLEAVIQARNQAVAARESVQKQGGPTEGSLKELLGAEATLGGALGKVFALVESYPQLRASEPLMKLQEELSSTENKVAFSRQAYNDQVLDYNTAQQHFPTLLLAGVFGHHPADLYEVENVEVKKAPKVAF
jgi:LemA protein